MAVFENIFVYSGCSSLFYLNHWWDAYHKCLVTEYFVNQFFAKLQGGECCESL